MPVDTKITLRTQDKSLDINQWTQEIISHAPLLLGKVISNTNAKSTDMAFKGLSETIKFLYLCSQSSVSLTPSQMVDQIWHELILFTRTYEQFCHNHLRQFIHHQPSSNPTLEKNQYLNTLARYKHIFGQPDNTYWPLPEDNIAHCGLCET